MKSSDNKIKIQIAYTVIAFIVMTIIYYIKNNF